MGKLILEFTTQLMQLYFFEKLTVYKTVFSLEQEYVYLHQIKRVED